MYVRVCACVRVHVCACVCVRERSACVGGGGEVGRYAVILVIRTNACWVSSL